MSRKIQFFIEVYFDDDVDDDELDETVGSMLAAVGDGLFTAQWIEVEP